MSTRDIYFIYPEAASLMAFLLPLLIFQFSLVRYRWRQTRAFASPSSLNQILVPRSSLSNYLKIIFMGFAWLFFCLSLMDPQGNWRYRAVSPQQPQQEFTNFSTRQIPHEVVFLVDTSASMNVADTSDGKTRLDRAKDLIDDILAQLRGTTVSLYAFTSSLTPLVPSTQDYLFTRLVVKSLSINQGEVGGTDFTHILSQLAKKLFPFPKNKLYTLILFSDGGDNQFESLQGNERQKALNHLLDILPNPEDFHFRLFTIGLGADQPSLVPDVSFHGKPVYSKLEPALLEELAKRYRGMYYIAYSGTTWNLAQEIKQKILEDSQHMQPVQSLERKVIKTNRADLLSDLYYQIPLALAIIFLIISLLLPNVRRL